MCAVSTTYSRFKTGSLPGITATTLFECTSLVTNRVLGQQLEAEVVELRQPLAAVQAGQQQGEAQQPQHGSTPRDGPPVLPQRGVRPRVEVRLWVPESQSGKTVASNQ